MIDFKNKLRAFNKTHLQVVGILILLALAIFLLWFQNSNSMQSIPALVAQVYFDGEYKIGDGDWQTIVEGNHIPSTEGDVTLRGNFHMLAPDGSYVGVYRGDVPIAFYVNHINLTFIEAGFEPGVIDMETPIYGESACGAGWDAYTFMSDSE